MGFDIGRQLVAEYEQWNGKELPEKYKEKAAVYIWGMAALGGKVTGVQERKISRSSSFTGRDKERVLGWLIVTGMVTVVGK